MLPELETWEGYRRTVLRQGAGLVPGHADIHPSVRKLAPELFERVKRECPHVVVTTGEGDPRSAKPYAETDEWGITWQYPGDYLAGQAVTHPLDSWEKFRAYRVPDIETYQDWKKVEAQVAEDRRKGLVAWGGIAHNFIYLKMTHLRGFENFMLDAAEERCELFELADRLAEFYVKVARRLCDMGANALSTGDDLGHQNTMPISPALWRRLLKPAFAKVFRVCRDAGVLVYLHTDGWIVPIIPDLIEVGVDILNPQDLVNGLDNLASLAKGKVGIDLDVDRQNITAFGAPAEVDAHVRACVEKLGSPSGGLILKYYGWPGTPPDNAAQVVLSMERYHALWM